MSKDSMKPKKKNPLSHAFTFLKYVIFKGSFCWHPSVKCNFIRLEESSGMIVTEDQNLSYYIN